MRYLQHRSRKPIGPVARGALIALAVLVIAIIVRALVPFVQPMVLDTFSYVSGGSSEADQLFEELRSARMDYDALLNDYAQLQAIVGDATGTARVARVISHPMSAPRDTLIAQIREGEVGEIVYADGNRRYALGRVTELGSYTARVELFSRSEASIEARVGNENIPVSITGMGGGEMQFTAPRDVEIVVGDAVFINGGATRIGFVEDVVVLESDPEQTARLRLFENINTIQFVYTDA